jgi:hypothetical protein
MLCHLLAWFACLIFAVSRLSIISSFNRYILFTMSCARVSGAEWSVSLVSGRRICGDFPNHSWKGVYLVDLFTVFMMLKWTLERYID